MVRERRKDHLGVIRRVFVVFVIGWGVLASAYNVCADIRVAVPLDTRVASQEKMSWRDASGHRGSGTSFTLGDMRYPVRVRGKQPAKSGAHSFPLPIEIVQHGGKPYVILTLDMSAYLAGVLPHEMNVNWPDEALKAQAVLARTFALRRRFERQGSALPYDVIASTADQEYRWQANVSTRIQKLVRATGNEIMQTRSGSPAQVFYHSCSGGMTADAAEIWNNSVPGVVPVRDPNDSVCPDYFWSVHLSPAELGGIFSLHPVLEINILERGPSGRVTRLLLNDDHSPVDVSGQQFRSKIGASRIKSTLFEVRTTELDGTPVWMFQGSGSGHGVGMSQFGAKTLAEEGKSYREILAFYFPQLKLGR